MPPSEKVSREDIVRGAVEVVEREGLGGLTARRVATQLNVSTAPVYRHFESMEELGRAVMVEARDRLLRYTGETYTDRPFLNMGTGIALFARDHRRLYRALFLESDEFSGVLQSFLDQLTEDMVKDPRFANMDRNVRAELLERMWTYTHGLASMIAVGLAKNSSTEAIVRSLDAVGGAVIRDMLRTQGEAPPKTALPRRARRG